MFVSFSFALLKRARCFRHQLLLGRQSYSPNGKGDPPDRVAEDD
jgi:hypothetical protein